MTTVRIPPWNVHGVLPPFWVGGLQPNRDGHLRLRAEAIVLERLLSEITEADARSRDFLRDRLGSVERQLARTTLSDGPIAAESTPRTDISEATEALVGEFLGVLPTGREFEFRLAQGGEVINGFIGIGIAQPRSLNTYLKRTASIRVVATRVDDGPPCYRLVEVCAWVSDVPEVPVPPTPAG